MFISFMCLLSKKKGRYIPKINTVVKAFLSINIIEAIEVKSKEKT